MADEGNLKGGSGKGSSGKREERRSSRVGQGGKRPAAPKRQPSASKPSKPTSKPASKPSGGLPRQPATSRPAAKPASVQRDTAKPKPAVGAVGKQASSSAATERQQDIELIRRSFNQAQAGVNLSSISSTIGSIDAAVRKLPTELSQLRGRGYAHAGQLEERIQGISQQWRTTRPRVESSLRSQQTSLRSEANQVEQAVQRMTALNASSLSLARSAVDGLESQLRAASSSLEGLYGDMEMELHEIENDLRKVSKMLDLIDASPEIQLRKSEGPLLAVPAEWRKDGKEGPDGNLILTDQRLLFEQNEKVATKKLFGLFATEKETVQNLLFDVPAYEIESAQANEDGGFLGMGKEEILDFVLGASAPVTRARFHLKGQDSQEWVMWINRVKSGEIDAFRHTQYREEVQEAAALALTFPSQCPACFAAVPTPPRGMTSVTCDFCGAIIKPEGTA